MKSRRNYTTGCGFSDKAEWLEKSKDEEDDAIPVHPLGVKPSGNGLTASGDIRPAMGGFALLPDELILILLESFDAATLRRLGSACKALYAFTRAEELWKALFIKEPQSKFSWQGDWHSTYLNLPPSEVASPNCSQLFSDTLHRPFQCAHLSLSTYTAIPARNQIPRLANLSQVEFDESWADRPFILTQPVKEWPVFQSWSVQYILDKYADTLFRAEAVDWPFRTYADYMNNNSDESPLYLFDKNFVSKMGLRGGDDAAFWPPSCFGDDLFAVLGCQRPDKEWLIIGPARSGSTFHKDPNATSAWNAVLRGSKYWIMFPGSASLPPPPGVYVSADQSEVTSPLSIAEWLLNFHEEARNMTGCLEGVCGEGEVLHVPSGWWHLVVNLSESVAITQNFVPRKHLRSTLDFMKNKPDQVSGFRKDIVDPYGLFVQKMKEAYPDMLEQALQEMEAKKKRKWDEVVKVSDSPTDDPNVGGFSFGFGDDSDAEVP
ncbi:F-box protein [Microsporum canis CBS 113480]|uniref:F-box protein n=1 Tax=Arthroderma otae (strain ATCC MYA-4605 / CBS 113480) TaxID=554155 RepID=C5FTX0_ARTOC|nr:F-box protein [Microsporum canis CBS 113480]EEQ33354.1 F-box protein [Microsporum canis CBS 113480]